MRVLFGFLCIVILSPAALWFAESQHKAADIKSAAQIDANAPAQAGYVVISGPSIVTAPVPCPQDSQITDTACVYSRTMVETYTESKQTDCGTISSSQKILGPAPDQCTNGSCEKCYFVASDSWQTSSDNSQFAPFVIGSYTVVPNADVTFVGVKTVQVGSFDANATPAVGTTRTTFKYLPTSMAHLAVGEAANGQIDSGAPGKVFAISAFDYNGTLQGLAEEDTSIMWALRIASLILMIVGFVLLTSPFESLFTMVFKFIPIIGSVVDRGISGVLHLLSGLLGLLVWLVLFVLVLLVKNILVVGVLLVVVAAIILGIMKMKGPTALTPKQS